MKIHRQENLNVTQLKEKCKVTTKRPKKSRSSTCGVCENSFKM